MIQIATKRAHESTFHRARVGAVIVKGNRVLSSGCNGIGFTRHLRDRPYPESVHAEQRAIVELLKQRRLGDLIGADIYISRIGASNEPRLARPCKYCLNLIRAVGIDKIYYTTNDGRVETA